MKKTTLLLALALAIMGSIVGCGSGDSAGTSSDKQAGDTKPTEASAKPNASGNGVGKVPTPATGPSPVGGGH